MYGVYRRVTRKRYGHGECKRFNGPKSRTYKICKARSPSGSVNRQAEGLVMLRREHDRY
jgi:hypothetical protein